RCLWGQPCDGSSPSDRIIIQKAVRETGRLFLRAAEGGRGVPRPCGWVIPPDSKNRYCLIACGIPAIAAGPGRAGAVLDSPNAFGFPGIPTVQELPGT